MDLVQIWTDGSCLGNGNGGWGAVLYQPSIDLYKEIYGCAKNTTNNRMELMAAIKGLELLKEPCEVQLTSDSEYVVKNMSAGYASRWKRQGWRISSGAPAINPDLWERMLALAAIHKCEFFWVKGHNGHPQNEQCDKLATEAARWQLKM